MSGLGNHSTSKNNKVIVLLFCFFLIANDRFGVCAFQPITHRACCLTSPSSPLYPRTRLVTRKKSSKRSKALTVYAATSATDVTDAASNRASQTERGWATVGEIAAIGVPALGSMLIDPIMSLVDTACVGQVSSVQVAAMAPCTSIYQFFFLVFFFLSTTTTNLVAANQDNEDYNERVVSCATSLALVCGTVLAGLLMTFADPLLAVAGCSSELLTYARPYLLIRALGLPLVLVATVLQGASLGKQDAWTPLKIFLSAGVFNLVGDVFLTLRCGWGVTGAAVATVISQCAAAIYYAAKSMRPTKKEHDTVKLRWKGLPDAKLVREFGVVAASLFLKSITQMGGYSWLTKASAPMGAVALAAHQVTLQVWWLLSYLPEPCSIAAQSLVARDFRKNSFGRVQQMVRVLYACSLLAGVSVAVLTGLALTLPRVVPLFVRDKAVHALLRTTAGPAMLAQVLCAVVSVSDGVAVGCGSLRHLPLNSALAMGMLGLALVGRRSVQGVWVALLAFHGSRLAGHFLMSKTMRNLLLRSGHANTKKASTRRGAALALEYSATPFANTTLLNATLVPA